MQATCRQGRGRVLAPMFLTLLLVASASPAEAHRLKAFATVEGSTIMGSAYFPGMGVARGVDVQVLAPDGSLLAETATDDQGRFTVKVRQRVDHRIIVDSGDGHRAEYLVRADELPESLPGPPGRAAEASATVASATPSLGCGRNLLTRRGPARSWRR